MHPLVWRAGRLAVAAAWTFFLFLAVRAGVTGLFGFGAVLGMALPMVWFLVAVLLAGPHPLIALPSPEDGDMRNDPALWRIGRGSVLAVWLLGYLLPLVMAPGGVFDHQCRVAENCRKSARSRICCHLTSESLAK